MTTELERKFFETFEIEKKRKYYYITQYSDTRAVYTDDHPTITDTHYLELLCILGEYDESYCFNNVKKLKETILKGLIIFYEWCIKEDFKDSFEWEKELKEKIQALFKE